MKKINILGIKIDDLDKVEALNLVDSMLSSSGKNYIVTPNPEIVLKARKDHLLKKILNNSSLSLPDGFGLKIAAKILKQNLKNRITGADFMLDICLHCAKNKVPIFLLGGFEEKIAKSSADKLKSLFPELIISGYSSGGRVFKKGNDWILSDVDVLEKINRSRAKVLFVGFGCPVQEEWVSQNLKKIENIKIAMVVGGTFDYLSGNIARSPIILRKVGLEWLWRLIIQPQRFRRILNATLVFLYKVILWRMRMSFVYRKNVAGFLINSNNKILLVQRANEKEEHWQLPQGGVKAGETEEQAIIREMKEETGLLNLKIIGKFSKQNIYQWALWQKINWGYRGQNQTIFYLKYEGKENNVIIDNEEISKYRWVGIKEAVNIVHPYRKDAVGKAVKEYLRIFK